MPDLPVPRAARRRIAWIAALCAAPLVAAVRADGAGYRLEGQVMYGGGGHSAAAHAGVAGSIGQPAAGRAAGAHYAIDGGFWTPQRVDDRIFANGFERTQP